MLRKPVLSASALEDKEHRIDNAIYIYICVCVYMCPYFLQHLLAIEKRLLIFSNPNISARFSHSFEYISKNVPSITDTEWRCNRIATRKWWPPPRRLFFLSISARHTSLKDLWRWRGNNARHHVFLNK